MLLVLKITIKHVLHCNVNRFYQACSSAINYRVNPKSLCPAPEYVSTVAQQCIENYAIIVFVMELDVLFTIYLRFFRETELLLKYFFLRETF